MVVKMIKLIKNWNYFFNEVEKQKLVKKTGKKLDLFSLLMAFIIILLPYLILMFNVIFVFSTKTILLHVFLWTIPIMFNVFVTFWYTFTYQLLKIYLKDEPLLESMNTKLVFLGGLINHITIISFFDLTAIMEFIL